MSIRNFERFFSLLLVVIIGLNVMDLWADYQTEPDLVHALLEVCIIVLSLGGLWLLLQEVMTRRKELQQLQIQLNKTRQALSDSNEKLQQAGREYSKVIQEQYITWQLTPSEKEVASLLLKGLSLDEIASVRKTKERTVRQQASAIYRKSGLNGRHEFAAWFFEDFLS